MCKTRRLVGHNLKSPQCRAYIAGVVVDVPTADVTVVSEQVRTRHIQEEHYPQGEVGLQAEL